MPKNQKRASATRTEPRYRSLEIGKDMFDAEKRSLTLSFASETPVKDWWGDDEILEVSDAALDLNRFEKGVAPVLFNHDRDAVIARIDKVWIEEKKAYATVTFDDDDESLKIMKKVESGSLRGISVGYRVRIWEFVDDDSTSKEGWEGPCYIARKWELLEISVVSVPADPEVAAGRSEESHEDKPQNKTREDDKTMTPEEKLAMEAAQKRALEEAEAKARSEAAEAETNRCTEIMALCRDFNVDPQEYVTSKRSVDEVRKEVLEKLRKERQAPPAEQTKVTADSEDKFRAAAADGILLRAGLALAKPAEDAGQFRSMRLRDIAIECLERSGVVKPNRLSDDELIRTALTGAGAFPGILSNVANKSISDGHQAAEATFDIWTATGSNTDFKAATQYRLSEAGNLEKISESGEFKNDVPTEESVTKSVLTYGRKFSITRKAIINDDLSALTRIPASYAASARRGINALVYKTLASSSGIFTSAHKNLASTGTALSVASLSEGRRAMKRQKNIRGVETLNLSPKFILVPTALETTAEQLFSSLSDPASANSGVRNPFVGKYTIVSDAELDEYSETAWYLLAQAGLVDTIEVTYLNGVTTPTLESRVAFDILGMEWRIFIDYGVTALDYRGMYKNPGASV